MNHDLPTQTADALWDAGRPQAGVSSDQSWRAIPSERHVHLDRLILLQVMVCVGPAMLAVHLEHPIRGAQWLFLTVALSLVANLLSRAPPAGLALIVATMPALAMLRSLVLYNSIVVLLAIPVTHIILRSRRDLHQLQRTGIFLLFYLGLLYWLSSYILTGDYFRNLRVIEMVFSAAAVVLLAPRRVILATTLFGFLFTLVAIGLAFLGLSDRLSYAVVNGLLLGNPVAYGVPLAFVFALSTADGGKWLLIQRLPLVRQAVIVISGLLLLLSTSRASWLVAVVSIILIMTLNGSNRKFVLTGLLGLALMTTAVAQTRQGTSLVAWFNRTFSPDRTMLQRSSGRSDQWLLFPMVMSDAPPWGFGPGAGEKIYARYSLLSDQIQFRRGQPMAWHSLYLQMGVETGWIGLGILITLAGWALVRAYRHWTYTRELVPLLGITGFLIVAATVSGMDTGAGMFLGLGLLAGHGGTVLTVRTAPRTDIRAPEHLRGRLAPPPQ